MLPWPLWSLSLQENPGEKYSIISRMYFQNFPGSYQDSFLFFFFSQDLSRPGNWFYHFPGCQRFPGARGTLVLIMFQNHRQGNIKDDGNRTPITKLNFDRSDGMGNSNQRSPCYWSDGLPTILLSHGNKELGTYLTWRMIYMWRHESITGWIRFFSAFIFPQVKSSQFTFYVTTTNILFTKMLFTKLSYTKIYHHYHECSSSRQQQGCRCLATTHIIRTHHT